MREAARISAAKSRQALHPFHRNVTRSTSQTATSKLTKQESSDKAIKKEETIPLDDASATHKRVSSPLNERPAKKFKKEDDPPNKPLLSPSSSTSPLPLPSSSRKRIPKQSSPSVLRSKKLKSYAQYANKSPFPTFQHPTPSECHLALSILCKLHGPRTRPAAVTAPTSRAGCGDSPSVLDALVRTILSQNTSDANSTRAKLSMDKVYGGSDNWSSIVHGGESKLEEAIRCGGLAVVKSKVIISILRQVHEKYGKYSLDHLHTASSEEAMQEMLSFQGVGPKTASCVLMFCLKRESFAVDTHVWRITGLLGWRPKEATREQTQAHLEVMVPDEDKYGLHVLFVNHGKKCEECKAGGKNVGRCELRKAFRKEKRKVDLKDQNDGIKEEVDQ